MNYAISEETRKKLNKKLNEGREMKSIIAPATMREYYSRVWLVTLKNDIPPAYNECHNSGFKVHGSEAWIMEKNEYDRIVRRKWKGQYVTLRDKVYNNTPYWLRAKDSCGNRLLYYAVKDMLGTVWADRTYWRLPEGRHWECCSESSSYSSSSFSSSSSSFSSSSSGSYSGSGGGSQAPDCTYCLQEHSIQIHQLATEDVEAIEGTITGLFMSCGTPIGTPVHWYSWGGAWPYSVAQPANWYGINSDNIPFARIVGYGKKYCFDEDHWMNFSDPEDLSYGYNLWNKRIEEGKAFGTHS